MGVALKNQIELLHKKQDAVVTLIQQGANHATDSESWAGAGNGH